MMRRIYYCPALVAFAATCRQQATTRRMFTTSRVSLDVQMLKEVFGEDNWKTFADKMPNWEKELNGMGKDTLNATLVACDIDALRTPALSTALVDYFNAPVPRAKIPPGVFPMDEVLARQLFKDEDQFRDVVSGDVSDLRLPPRFTQEGDNFKILGTEPRASLAYELLRSNSRCTLLTGPQGVGKSFFAFGLVLELRRLQPEVPVMYLPEASFQPFTAGQALKIALQKAGVPGVLNSAYVTVEMVAREMRENRPVRLVIDQMNTAFRTHVPNENYRALLNEAAWSLLVTSFTRTDLKLSNDMPIVEYNTVKFDFKRCEQMLLDVLHEDLKKKEIAEHLYHATGGNPLELRLLVQALKKKSPATSDELRAAVRVWYADRVHFVKLKLTQHSKVALTALFREWSSNRATDRRFFASNGSPLFPAVHSAMKELLKFGAVEIAVWVRVHTAEAASPQRASAFQVTPEIYCIFSLKYAIKAKLGMDYTGNPALITIYDPAGADAKTPLALAPNHLLDPFNTDETAYRFELPK